MEEIRFKDNELWCEEARLNDVAERFGTPLYVYSKRSVIDHCRHIERAFGSIDHLSTYAIKANANREVLIVLAREGIGADAGSIGELHMALDAGFSPEKITFTGVGKRDDEIEFALQKNILALNAESAEEIDVINDIASRMRARARILLRVNFDIPSETHPYITTGRKQNKFGVEYSEAKKILGWAAKLPHIELMGIHSHIGSQITNSGTFKIAAEEIIQFIREVRNAGIPIHHLNFGGGFGVQYHDYVKHSLLPKEEKSREEGLATVNLLEEFLPILQQAECKILIQPGRSIVAHAGVLLTKILYRKQNVQGKTFVIVDAGMNDLIRPSLYQSYHQIVPLRLQEQTSEIVDVVGPLCESGDFFAIDRPMNIVGRGEYLAVLCTGAYGYVLSSNYNGRPRPAEVVVDGDGYHVTTKRETIEQL